MLALDVVLLFMIVICIVYCWVLNQRIRDLHNSRVEFARMIKEFDAAVIKAEGCTDDLSSLSKTATEHVKKAADDADMVISELKTVYEIGDKTSAKLEESIKEARKQQNALASSSQGKDSKKPSTQSNIKEEESEIVNNDNFDVTAEEEGYLAEEYIEDKEVPAHQNLLEKVLHKITTHKHHGTVDQNSYYDTLKKVSVRK
jgi:hypothetical protein